MLAPNNAREAHAARAACLRAACPRAACPRARARSARPRAERPVAHFQTDPCSDPWLHISGLRRGPSFPNQSNARQIGRTQSQICRRRPKLVEVAPELVAFAQNWSISVDIGQDYPKYCQDPQNWPHREHKVELQQNWPPVVPRRPTPPTTLDRATLRADQTCHVWVSAHAYGGALLSPPDGRTRSRSIGRTLV